VTRDGTSRHAGPPPKSVPIPPNFRSVQVPVMYRMFSSLIPWFGRKRNGLPGRVESLLVQLSASKGSSTGGALVVDVFRGTFFLYKRANFLLPKDNFLGGVVVVVGRGVLLAGTLAAASLSRRARRSMMFRGRVSASGLLPADTTSP